MARIQFFLLLPLGGGGGYCKIPYHHYCFNPQIREERKNHLDRARIKPISDHFAIVSGTFHVPTFQFFKNVSKPPKVWSKKEKLKTIIGKKTFGETIRKIVSRLPRWSALAAEVAAAADAAVEVVFRLIWRESPVRRCGKASLGLWSADAIGDAVIEAPTKKDSLLRFPKTSRKNYFARLLVVIW